MREVVKRIEIKGLDTSFGSDEPILMSKLIFRCLNNGIMKYLEKKIGFKEADKVIGELEKLYSPFLVSKFEQGIVAKLDDNVIACGNLNFSNNPEEPDVVAAYCLGNSYFIPDSKITSDKAIGAYAFARVLETLESNAREKGCRALRGKIIMPDARKLIEANREGRCEYEAGFSVEGGVKFPVENFRLRIS